MPKEFERPVQREPKSMPAPPTSTQSDPAFLAAQNAFPMEATTEVATEIVARIEPLVATSYIAPAAPPQEKKPEVESALAIVSQATAVTTRRLSKDKLTIYPGETERKRLQMLRFNHHIAESIIAEYAIEELFRTRSDDAILAAVKAQGHGLRRARPASK